MVFLKSKTATAPDQHKDLAVIRPVSAKFTCLVSNRIASSSNMTKQRSTVEFILFSGFLFFLLHVKQKLCFKADSGGVLNKSILNFALFWLCVKQLIIVPCLHTRDQEFAKRKINSAVLFLLQIVQEEKTTHKPSKYMVFFMDIHMAQLLFFCVHPGAKKEDGIYNFCKKMSSLEIPFFLIFCLGLSKSLRPYPRHLFLVTMVPKKQNLCYGFMMPVPPFCTRFASLHRKT